MKKLLSIFLSFLLICPANAWDWEEETYSEKYHRHTLKNHKTTSYAATATSTVPTLFEEVRDRLVQSSIQTGVATSVQIITEDLRWKDALKQGVINTGVSSFGALGANKLSLLYNGGKGSWNYAAHKLGHFALGGVMGAASNYKDPFKGFLSGCAGGMCAEVIMEGLPSTMRMSDSSRLTRALIGTGTFLAGGNVTITDLTATNAIENNSFMPSPYPEVQEQQYKNMKATGEYLTNLLGEDAPGFADARAWFSSGCDVLNDMYFGLLPGISPENRAFMENQLPWNMATDLIPAKVGEVGLVAVPLLRTGGQGAKAVFKALPSKGLTPNLATESGHALRVYTTRELASEAMLPRQGGNLLPAPDMVKHHVFNKFRGTSPASQKYRDFFKKHDISIDEFTIEITDSLHKSHIHKAGNNWTTRWKGWIDANPNASTKEVYQFGGQLMDEYGVNRLPLKPYRSIKEKK